MRITINGNIAEFGNYHQSVSTPDGSDIESITSMGAEKFLLETVLGVAYTITLNKSTQPLITKIG